MLPFRNFNPLRVVPDIGGVLVLVARCGHNEHDELDRAIFVLL